MTFIKSLIILCGIQTSFIVSGFFTTTNEVAFNPTLQFFKGKNLKVLDSFHYKNL